ncbi:integrin alpha-M isoform X2 [Lepisosteus oculatus]|uniref:integrin alpha-M isoform X2 n=1 Tax=Lepisosteus oculatus TaxID=7918 RepID=UPI00370F8E69
MTPGRILFSLGILLSAGGVSEGFNIDTTSPIIYSGSSQDYFGYKTIQYGAGQEKWIIVSAPLKDNRTGGIYKCAYEPNSCQLILNEVTVMDSVKAVGLSLAARMGSNPQLTTCSPSLAHGCASNMYLNSICYQFDQHLQLTGNLTPSYQGCFKRDVDLVFLFDGSESLTPADFEKNKEFIVDIMRNLTNSSIQFAAVQFSTTFRTEFTFEQYQQRKNLAGLLKDAGHMKSLTNTHEALDFTVNHVLYNKTAGAKDNGTKVLIIITDGDPTDFDDYNIVDTLNNKGIIRYVIGVGNLDLRNLKKLSSEPKENNTFYIQNYGGLKNVLDNLQNKIYSIEGVSSTNKKKFEKEMSQTGFSALYNEDSLMLGAVGYNNWQGSVSEISPSLSETPVIPVNVSEDSYLGYALARGLRGPFSLLAAGAPRAEHRGTVLLFRKSESSTRWEEAFRLSGQQIGSYFGGELCSLDVDSDNQTDFLLVGAPLHYEDQREGMVFVYKVADEGFLSPVQNISGATSSPFSRFGSAMASLQDLNGDGLDDVAVGAPLENDHRGALYIYLGDREDGIKAQYSQHILAETLSPRLRYFGHSVSGLMDLSADGLTDITVGAMGDVIVLRSRPVLSVWGRLSFEPTQISLAHFDCLGVSSESPVLNLTVCFSVELDTKNTPDTSGLNVTYQLDLDSVRQRSRATFSGSKLDLRKIQDTVQLPQRITCHTKSVYMENCVKDTVSPVKIKLTFSQTEGPSSPALTPILNIDSRNVEYIEVPFEKNCGANDTCIADLHLDFNFSSPSLLVVHQGRINVMVKLANRGEDSYNTSLLLLVPRGLSFSKMEVIEASRRTLASCNVESPEKTLCSVSPPVYRGDTTAVFLNQFRISPEADWNETMEITVKAHSDNGKFSNETVLTKEIPVLFAIDVTVKGLDSNYFNFTVEDIASTDIKHEYEVKNEGQKGLPIDVAFTIPTQFSSNFWWNVQSISSDMEKLTQCENIASQTAMEIKECEALKCKVIVCQIAMLEKGSSIHISFSGPSSFNVEDLKGKLSFSEERIQVDFSSSAQLSYDTRRYVQYSSSGDSKNNQFHKAKFLTKAELVIPPHTAFITGVGIGGGLLVLIILILILYKLGFFKRNKHNYEQEREQAAMHGEPGAEPDPEAGQDGGAVPGKAPAEKKGLLGTDTPEGGTDDEMANGKEGVKNGSEAQAESK